jgi:arginase family enzyme
MAAMGIDAHKEIMTPIGRPIRFSDATPLARLLKDDVASQVIRS